MNDARVWVFTGESTGLPSGVFSTRDLAEAWIRKHSLSGMLTAYPLDKGAYEWATEVGYFKPKKPTTPAFIGRFTSAYQEHYHYDDGIEAGAKGSEAADPGDAP